MTVEIKTHLRAPVVHTVPFEEALATLNLPHLDRNLFSSPDWMKVIQKTYGLRLFVKCVEEGGEIRSYVIYSVVHNFLEWKVCVCSYCDYADGYISRAEHWNLLFQSLREEYPQYRIAIRSLHDPLVQQCPHFKELSREKHHELDVRRHLDELWESTPRTFKVAYKTATKSGLRLRRCEKKHLKDFYQLHLQLRRSKYKIFPQPYRFFENVWDQYMTQDKGVLFGLFDEEDVLQAAHIYLTCGEKLYYKFSTSSAESLKYRPNNLLIWEGIKYAKEWNLKFVDLGSSEYDQHGLIWFKTHILNSTIERDIVHMGYAPENYVFSRKIILKTYTRFFTQPWMPDGMVAWGSNWIYPYLA